MRELITEHPEWTYNQYAIENARRFKDTHYTDTNGKQHSEKRRGRGAAAIRTRYRNFVADMWRDVQSQGVQQGDKGHEMETTGQEEGPDPSDDDRWADGVEEADLDLDWSLEWEAWEAQIESGQGTLGTEGS